MTAWKLALVLMVPQISIAREIRFEKKVDVGVLQKQLIDAGFHINWIECSVNRCKIVMPDSEKKDPMPVVKKYVYIDPTIARKKTLADMQALYAKWEGGTITPTEKDELLKMLVKQTLGL